MKYVYYLTALHFVICVAPVHSDEPTPPSDFDAAKIGRFLDLELEKLLHPNDERRPLSAAIGISPQLQFGCAGILNKDEEEFGRILQDESATTFARLDAAERLWKSRSRKFAIEILRYLNEPHLGGGLALRELKREIDNALEPDAILRELKGKHYNWGAWLAFLRPNSDLVHVLIASLETVPESRPATILALGSVWERT